MKYNPNKKLAECFKDTLRAGKEIEEESKKLREENKKLREETERLKSELLGAKLRVVDINFKFLSVLKTWFRYGAISQHDRKSLECMILEYEEKHGRELKLGSVDYPF